MLTTAVHTLSSISWATPPASMPCWPPLPLWAMPSISLPRSVPPASFAGTNGDRQAGRGASRIRNLKYGKRLARWSRSQTIVLRGSNENQIRGSAGMACCFLETTLVLHG